MTSRDSVDITRMGNGGFMRGVNKVIIVGRLGNDPEIKYTSQGTAVARFRVATNEAWTGKDGTKQERTDWHRIVVWGKQGENCSEYLYKGRPVYIEGSLRTSSWEDKDGNKKFMTEVIARDVQFLGELQKSQNNKEFSKVEELPSLPQEEESEAMANPDSDIPF